MKMRNKLSIYLSKQDSQITGRATRADVWIPGTCSCIKAIRTQFALRIHLSPESCHLSNCNKLNHEVNNKNKGEILYWFCQMTCMQARFLISLQHLKDESPLEENIIVSFGKSWPILFFQLVILNLKRLRMYVKFKTVAVTEFQSMEGGRENEAYSRLSTTHGHIWPTASCIRWCMQV